VNSNGTENVREGTKGKPGIYTMANLGKTAMRTIDRGESKFTVILRERKNDIYVGRLT